eukprot:CAMPEP_0170206122 /NCGR_PEP_ID=MMETSP0116_2-20130129/2611_1 /TAXON_ID=400756 /ORGANISM="Durinskia baltica, Strain CSIRO CS-38" /LENGTH=35 /DNA_ID= /DNA_START= /DNA_END= /DNA_ORIENTATION=
MAAGLGCAKLLAAPVLRGGGGSGCASGVAYSTYCR